MRFILEPADRPPTVAWFEWLSILILTYDCVTSDVHWLAVLAYALFMLWIILAVSRLISRGDRWLLTVLNAVLFLAFLLLPGEVQWGLATVADAIEWIALVLHLVTLWLLWSRPTSEWIASGPRD